MAASVCVNIQMLLEAAEYLERRERGERGGSVVVIVCRGDRDCKAEPTVRALHAGTCSAPHLGMQITSHMRAKVTDVLGCPMSK